MGLPIYAASQLVAQIEASADGTWLQHETAWNSGRDSFPISLTMTLTQARYRPEVVVPWLMNATMERAGDAL